MCEMQTYPNPQAGAPTAAPTGAPAAEAPAPDILEEFALLMSLALDDALAVDEAQRFAALIAAYPLLAEQWAEWRTLATELAHLPHVLPTPGFVTRFEQRLAAEEARQQRWVLGASVGATLVTMAVVLVSLVGAGSAVLPAQGVWIGQQLHNLTYALLLADRWLNTMVDTAFVVLGTPQARVVGLLYTTMALGMILLWVQLVRRSGAGSTVGAAPMMPAGE